MNLRGETMDVLVVDDGEALVGFDCREVRAVEEAEPGEGPWRYRVLFGRGASREGEVPCRDVVGFLPLTPRSVRPVPAALAERLPPWRRPWAVGICDRGLFLLY